MDAFKISPVILMGAGWFNYQRDPDIITRFIHRMIFHKTILHSVRDRYTELMLRKCGISNVIYTGCPTMWKLDEAKISTLPKEKADEAIVTVTAYKPDKSDAEWLQQVQSNYRKVYFWPQMSADLSYIRMLGFDFEIVPPSVAALRAFFLEKEVDYIGSRLHGGIFSLLNGRRALVIGIDNRAIEIGKDTGLPVVSRKSGMAIGSHLDSLKFELELPWTNIDRWKSQFCI